jgi:hypothetical protein
MLEVTYQLRRNSGWRFGKCSIGGQPGILLLCLLFFFLVWTGCWHLFAGAGSKLAKDL